MKRSGEASVSLASRHYMADPQPWGWLRQEVKADAYRGKRVRLTGYLQGHLEYGQFYASLIAIDSEARVVALDDIRHHELLLGPGWKKFSIVLEVPESAVGLSMGLSLQGRGKVWADDWQFEVVGKDVPTTSMGLGSEQDLKEEAAQRMRNAASNERFKRAFLASLAKMPAAPVNLDFEGKIN